MTLQNFIFVTQRDLETAFLEVMFSYAKILLLHKIIHYLDRLLLLLLVTAATEISLHIMLDYCDPGIDSTSNSIEYQGYLLAVKAAGA
jgi:hypothetical protein